MPVFGLPLMLVGLAALPALAGIYWLRTRFRRQPVSSLMLWRSVVEAQGGGRKKSRFQTPLALLLELLVIALLVVAATAPRVLRPGQTVAVTVVLDDSYSMTAVGSDGRTARDRAVALLEQELGRLPAYAVRLVAAGPEPRVLSGVATDWSGVEAGLAEWACAAGYADLEAGLGLAGEVSAPRARLLVLTDHTRERGGEASVEVTGGEAVSSAVEVSSVSEGVAGRLRWVSVGEASVNVGIVNAVRSHDSDTGDALLVEVANPSTEAASVELVLTRGPRVEAGQRMEPASGWVELERRRLEIGASGVGRVWIRPAGVADRVLAVSVSSSGDGLAADDRVVLMPAEQRLLPVSVEVGHPRLAAAVRRAVAASGRAAEVPSGEALLRMTDRPVGGGSPGAWVMRFDTGGEGVESEAYLGPFVIDFNHPMSEGLTLAGVVWAVPSGSPERGGGRAVVSTGNRGLIEEEASAGGGRRLVWRLVPERSTVLESAALPVGLWNLIDWRALERPGVGVRNVRPGVVVPVRASAGLVRVGRMAGDRWAVGVSPWADEVELDSEEVPLRGGEGSWVAGRSGVYALETPGRVDYVAVQSASSVESDLRLAVSEEAGQWDDAVSVVNEYQGLAWVLGLLALGLLVAHAWWLHRERWQGRRVGGGAEGVLA